MGLFDGLIAKTELDSHANMIVFGKHILVLNDTGKTAQVNGFSDDVGTMSKVPIVDGVCAYDCPKDGQTYLLVGRNVLHVPSMDHNLVPPFILREAGLEVNEKPKIHCNEATVQDHSIYDSNSGLRIPLELDGIFSTFPTRVLNQEEMENPGDYPLVFISPDAPSWDPHIESYDINEASYTDHRGEMVYPQERRRDLVNRGDVAEVEMQSPSSSTAI